MIKLVRGLFGSRQSNGGTVRQEESKPAPIMGTSVQQSQFQAASGAFFLEPDAAKTLGDLDYMRTKKTIRRTFPKTASAPNVKAITTTISSDVKETGAKAAEAAASVAPASASANVQEAASRRQADSGMDMFRSMAKQIRKN
ncbi:MAG TPA: hypothetical protein V6C46_08900 [Coleofasciculaceae cyanobacterium]